MDLRIFLEPQQGATYEQQLTIARLAEDLGFDAFFRSDHLMRLNEGDPGPGPTESWVTLGALARETSRIRLGTMVTSSTFRHPGMLAIAVAQVDAMSGGRVELGVGAGWFQREHEAYGVPEQALDTLGQWGEAGATRAYLQFLTLDDLDQLRLIGEEVLPRA